MTPIRETTKVLLTIILAMIAVWTLLYEITIRYCFDYFTYPPVFQAHSPSGLAASWGVLFGCEFGLVVGVAITWADPKLQLSRLVVPIGLLAGVMLAAAVVGSIVAYLATSLGFWSLSRFDASRIPEPLQRSFFVIRWTHLSAGLTGLGATAYVAGRALHQRLDGETWQEKMGDLARRIVKFVWSG